MQTLKARSHPQTLKLPKASATQLFAICYLLFAIDSP